MWQENGDFCCQPFALSFQTAKRDCIDPEAREPQSATMQVEGLDTEQRAEESLGVQVTVGDVKTHETSV
ncbi:hypothetical protein ROHU_031176 [Labeo rohita]|uniref:Uncharacterized protein n=1 Tax=Labeo rohita TaxID=84645 RepID=A0A498LRU3_LABRO|nr:hypothetical protein ROHU_031176 [Labeo rohita]